MLCREPTYLAYSIISQNGAGLVSRDDQKACIGSLKGIKIFLDPLEDRYCLPRKESMIYQESV